MRTWTLAALAAVVVGIVTATALRPPDPAAAFHGTWLGEGLEHAPVTLENAAGEAVTLEAFRGTPVLLFFGYASCPDVCPTTLAKLADATAALGDDAGRVRVVFVTVDPERDTPADADAYARRFDPRFIGLGGTPAQIEAAAKEYGILVQRAEGRPADHAHAGHGPDGSGANYLVAHSPHVLAVDADGRMRGVWGGDVAAAELTADMRVLLRLRNR